MRKMKIKNVLRSYIISNTVLLNKVFKITNLHIKHNVFWSKMQTHGTITVFFSFYITLCLLFVFSFAYIQLTFNGSSSSVLIKFKGLPFVTILTDILYLLYQLINNCYHVDNNFKDNIVKNMFYTKSNKTQLLFLFKL